MKAKPVEKEKLHIGLFLAKENGQHKLVKDLGPMPIQWIWSAVLKKNKDLGVPVDSKTGWLYPEVGQTICMIKSEV